MARQKETNECGETRAYQAEIGANRPMNDIERLQAENGKLEYILKEQEKELLNLYRKLNERIY